MRALSLVFVSLCAGCALAPVPPSVTREIAGLPSSPRVDDRALQGPSLDRASLIAAVLARDSARVASVRRARAALEDAEAARSLPAPEAGAQVWNVPFNRPWDLGAAQMIMVELRQQFTTAGLRGARATQRIADARMALAEVAARDQALLARASIAYAELVASRRHHAVHVAHLAVVDAMGELVRARVGATTGSIAAVARVDAERARVLRNITRYESERVRAARALNALLLRPVDAPLPDVIDARAEVAAEPVDALVARALTLRGELRAAEARVEGARAMHAEARAEATEPMVSAGFSAWLDPHMTPGYGLSAMTTLPWLWGGGAHRARAAALRTEADALERDARAAEVRAEVIDAHAQMEAAARALNALRGNAIPAATRSLDAARAAFASGNGALLEWVDAARMRVDLADEEAELTGMLLRAVAELEGRVGAALPRAPLTLETEASR